MTRPPRPSRDPGPAQERAALASLRLLLLCAFVSGAAALAYQSLWLRSFGLVFGNTTDALAMVLAVFMGGLGLGSLSASRRPAASPLLAYAWVEVGIGVTALVTVPLLAGLPSAYGALARDLDLSVSLEVLSRAVGATVILLPTTFLLGATIPLLVESMDRAGGGFPSSFGRICLFNTLGAAGGALLTTFGLVPALGIRATLLLGAISNIAVGLLARALSPTLLLRPAPVAPPLPRPVPVFLTVMAAISGAFTFGIEILWTRSLALVVGSTAYAFALMLLAVLLGLAAGTAGYVRFGFQVAHPARVLGRAFALAGLGALGSFVAIGALPTILLDLFRLLPATFAAQQLGAFSLCLLAMIPVMAVQGFAFPLLAHLVDPTQHSAQEASGQIYVWNTAGAIAGALATDLVLIRELGLQGSSFVLSGSMLAASAWVLVASASGGRIKRLAAVAGVALAVAGLEPAWRPWNPVVMTAGVHRYGPSWSSDPSFRLGDLKAQRRLLFYREGREAVVAAYESLATSGRFLSINGKTDAGGAPEDALQQKFIAHVPLLLHPAPRRVLVVGWGSGATAASAALYPLEHLDCVEIEPATYEAAPWFENLSGAVRRDPRFRIVFRDGRNYLLGSKSTWDVIVSEPSNAWISGVANLFTREYYEVARRRLAPGGLFAQWFHYSYLEPTDLKIELATFAAAFPQVSVWQIPPLPPELGGTLAADLLLVGGLEAHPLDWRRLSRIFHDSPAGRDLQSTGAIPDELSVVAAYAFGRQELLEFVRDRDAFPGGTPLNTDDQPWIEFRTARHLVLATEEVRRLAQGIYTQLGETGLGAVPPLQGGPALDGPEAARFIAALATRWMQLGLGRRAQQAFARALALDPDCESALDKLGSLAIDVRDWPRAEALHRSLLRLRPRDVDAHLRLGAILVREGKWLEAQGAFQTARRLDPQAPVAPEIEAYVKAQLAAR